MLQWGILKVMMYQLQELQELRLVGLAQQVKGGLVVQQCSDCGQLQTAQLCCSCGFTCKHNSITVGQRG